VLLAANRHVVPAGAVVVPLLLLGRSAWNLTRSVPAPPRVIGWSEMRAGAASVAAWVAAYLLAR
jgi:hypothetical protein